MKRHRFRLWLALLLGFLGTASFLNATDAGPAQKLRVLLITGGHGFEREPYLQVFRDNPAIALTHLEHTKGTADAWDRADLSACDVVVLYDMPRAITDAQKARFMAVFARGIGLVVTHHALVSYQGWPDYERIIGGRYVEPAEKGGDAKAKPSGYEHDVDLSVTVASPAHPITTGIADFTINDELYWNYRVSADVTPLLVAAHPRNSGPIAWYRTEGRSRVVYLMLGHGPIAFRNENFRRLLANSIRWAAPK